MPPGVVWWYVFGDAAREKALDGSGLGGYIHGFGWCAPLEAYDIVGPTKLPITVLEYMVLPINLIIFSPLIPRHASNWPMFGSDSLGSVLAVIDLKSKSPLIQLATDYIAAVPEVERFRQRLTMHHVYGSGNAFAGAESRGKDALIRMLARQLRVDYQRLPLPPRATAFIKLVRNCAREFARARERRQHQHEREPPRRQRQRTARHEANRSGPKSEQKRKANPFGSGVKIGQASNPVLRTVTRRRHSVPPCQLLSRRLVDCQHQFPTPLPFAARQSRNREETATHHIL